MVKKLITRAIKSPLEVAGELAKEAKRQITAKAPRPEETLGVRPSVGKKQRQKIQLREEEELKRMRMEKAKMLAEWRQRYQKIQEEELKAAKERERKREEEEKAGELEEEKKEERKKLPEGEEVLAATGAAQKRPTGLWGIGRRFKKLFKWFTPERKGKAPR